MIVTLKTDTMAAAKRFKPVFFVFISLASYLDIDA